MDIHVYGVDLVSVIFWSTFVHDSQVPAKVSWFRRHQLQLAVFLQGKENSSHCIAQVVNPMLLPFLRQEGDVLFQQDNACLYMAAGMQGALHGVQQLPWPARSTDLSPIERTWWRGNLTLSPEPAITIAELRQRVQDAWDNLSQDDIRHLYDSLHARNCIDVAKPHNFWNLLKIISIGYNIGRLNLSQWATTLPPFLYTTSSN